MKISFCTWIKSRLYQFRETIPRNLERAAAYEAEFVVVDAASPDGLAEWVQTRLAAELAAGRVRLLRRPEEPMQFPKFKNAAHRAATGEIVVNLDADNVIGPRYCDWLLAAMTSDVVAHAWTGDWLDGTCGRVALRRATFEALGGYDESLGPIGGNDLDLRDRAVASGRKCLVSRKREVVGGAMRNNLTEKLRHLPGVNYGVVNSENHQRTRDNIAAGRLVANRPDRE